MDEYLSIRIQLTGEGSIVMLPIRRDGRPPPGATLGSCDLDKLLKDVSGAAENVRHRKAKLGDLELLGEQLFAAMFPGLLGQFLCDAIPAFGALASTSADGTYLQLELDIDEAKRPDIAALPWELMRATYERGKKIWLCRHPRVALIRRRAAMKSRDSIVLDRPLKVLLVVSAPRVNKKIGPIVHEDVLKKLQELAQAVPPVLAPVVELHQPTLTTLAEGLELHKPDILHFIGHGRLAEASVRGAQVKNGEIALVNSLGDVDWAPADIFAEVFQTFAPAVVVLQSCESGAGASGEPFVSAAAQVLGEDVPVVLAMQHEISNGAAAVFTEQFYRQLREYNPVDYAVQRARQFMGQKFARDTQNLSTFCAPILFTKAQDLRLFTRPQQSARHSKDPEVVEQRRKLAEARESLAACREKRPPDVTEAAWWDELVRRERVVREARESLQQHEVLVDEHLADPPDWRPFEEDIIRTYPFPIAWLCEAFNRASDQGMQLDRTIDPGMQLDLLRRLFAALTKYLMAIYIGQARRDQLPASLVWPGVAERQAISSDLAGWVKALQWLVEHYRTPLLVHPRLFQELFNQCAAPLTNNSRLVEALRYYYIRSKQDPGKIAVGSVGQALAALANFAEVRYHDELTVDGAGVLVQRLQPALAALLAALAALADYPLLYVEWALRQREQVRLRTVKFMGLEPKDEPPLLEPSLIIPTSERAHVQQGSLVVAARVKVKVREKVSKVMEMDSELKLVIAEEERELPWIQPYIALHPFFIMRRFHMYLIARAEGPLIEYNSCSDEAQYRVPDEARTTYSVRWENAEAADGSNSNPAKHTLKDK